MFIRTCASHKLGRDLDLNKTPLQFMMMSWNLPTARAVTDSLSGYKFEFEFSHGMSHQLL